MPYNTQGLGAPAGKIVSGTVTVSNAGTAQQVSGTNTPIMGVWLSADLGATGCPLVIGDTNVSGIEGTQSGIVIVPGNMPIFLPIDNLNKLYVDSTENGGKLCYAYLQPWDSL